jgi:MurNAc alpha-1-phosphate uridylyltransferase
MAPLTDTCPKPLLLLAAKPLIVHHIEKLVTAGITDIVINHSWLGEKIEQALGDGSNYGCSIRYSAEVEALETAGGVYQALPLLGNEPFLLVNGDVWTNWRYERALTIQLAPSELGFLWLVDNPDHNPNGDFAVAEDGFVLPRSDKTGYTFSGLSVLRPELWQDFVAGVHPLAPMLRSAMARQQIRGEHLQAQWVDVGTPQRLYKLEQTLLAEAPQ